MLDQWKKGQPPADWKYSKNNLFTQSDEGYGKVGRELEGNGVKVATGAGKGEMQRKAIEVYLQKGKANTQVADLA